jgi:hypothetical protein
LIGAMMKPEKVYSKFKVTLTEPQCPDSSVEIKGIPENAIVIKIDNFPAPSSLFRGNKGECKRADYLIIAEYENKKKVLKKCVLFIELKRKTDSANEIKQQLIGAACCFRYIQEIGRRFWNNPKLLTNFEHRYICFRHTESVSKRSTRYSKDSGKHNSPDNIFKIDWPKKNIIFNHLAGA